MNKQKVCIIGAGLTGMVTAIVLKNCGLFVEIVSSNFDKKNISKVRSIALSNSSFSYLKRFNIFNNRFAWAVNKMKIYNLEKNFEIKEIFEFNKNKKKEIILHMLLNNFLYKRIKRKIKIKKIKIKKTNLNKIVLKKKYNLIINCTGPKSHITKNFFSKKKINFKYDELAIATCVKHDLINNVTTRQIFLKEGPLALLPISNTKTSIVWSLKKKFLPNKFKQRNKFIKNNLEFYLSYFLKINSMSPIEYNNINQLISTIYYSKRFLNFGDALHQVHPFVGQGFNMILRDLFIFEKILKNRIKLGLDIGDQSVLEEFSKKRKSQNFAFIFGVDFLKKFFNKKDEFTEAIKGIILKKINKNIFIKKKLFEIADEGINF